MTREKKLSRRVREIIATYREASRNRAVDTLTTELEELENIFSILVLGFLVGLPSPPVEISLELAPLMERELITMLDRVDTAAEPLAHLFSTFDIG